MEKPTRLTIAQAARHLGISERTLRRRVAEGKIEAVKDATPQTGVAWFIEQATVDALSKPAQEEEQKEEPADDSASVMVEPEAPAELARLRDEVREIKAFLLGRTLNEESEQQSASLGTIIERAIREIAAPVMERIERQSAENALLQEQLAQALERAAQAEAREAPTKPRLWWPFSKRR